MFENLKKLLFGIGEVQNENIKKPIIIENKKAEVILRNKTDKDVAFIVEQKDENAIEVTIIDKNSDGIRELINNGTFPEFLPPYNTKENKFSKIISCVVGKSWTD